MNRPTIKRALISVYDKTGIVDFARALATEFGVEIISTGGTATLLKKEGIPVTLVEEVTGFPELMDGRVKTLHPKIHAGILADRDNPDHMRQLAEHGIKPIDMVVVNLYPFDKTVADPNCTFAQAIEMIDIGGPCMLRAAAKNHKHVLAINSHDAYGPLLDYLRGKRNSEGVSFHQIEAAEVFKATTRYDAMVAEWLTGTNQPIHGPATHFLEFSELEQLRYGENPHQQAALWQYDEGDTSGVILGNAFEKAKVAMSFNNYLDASAAFDLCRDITITLGNQSALWDRLSSRSSSSLGATGQEQEDEGSAGRRAVGPAFQPVSPRLIDERHTRRHLPHIEKPACHYFVTFRLRKGEMSEQEREIVLNACKHWHGKKITMHACVIMPDHVHLLMTPHEVEKDTWVSLGEVLQSIKGYSARVINGERGTHGSLWMDENWDRIVRNEREYEERWNYIANNPQKTGLGENYPWLWLNHDAWEDLGSFDRLESRSHCAESGFHSATRAVAVYIKHTNACGVGISDDPIEAYRRAYVADPNAAMGGILAVSFPVDVAFAEAVMESLQRWGKAAGAGAFFAEVWLAPEFDEKAVEVIRTRKPWGANVRLLSVDAYEPDDPTARDFRRIPGGFLVQSKDTAALDEDQWKVVTKRQPTDTELADLRLAWLIAKHTKSNAISLVKGGMLIGNGAGQMSRVMSCRIATWLAKENGHVDKLAGSVAASDAFFPFSDGPQILFDAGATALIQPGGSKRDEDTIKLCDDRGAAMIFTGTRHFRH